MSLMFCGVVFNTLLQCKSESMRVSKGMLPTNFVRILTVSWSILRNCCLSDWRFLGLDWLQNFDGFCVLLGFESKTHKVQVELDKCRWELVK